MGKGRSGQGGGLRDNRKWDGGGTGKQDGYRMFGSNEEITDTMGLGNGGQTDKWDKKLTPQEEVAVEWYTGNGHRPLNEFERKGKVSGASGEKLTEYSDNLESALDKGRNPRMIVNRTSDSSLLGGAHTVEDIRKMYGQTVTDKGFTSTELNLANSLANPYGSKHSDQVYYHIKTPAGKGIGQYVQGISGAHQEQEFLFNRGSSFKVLGAYADAEGRVHANLKYVGRAKGGR